MKGIFLMSRYSGVFFTYRESIKNYIKLKDLLKFIIANIY